MYTYRSPTHTEIRKKFKVFSLNIEIICCSIYKEWKAIEYLHGIGNNTIHKETNISEDQ